MNRSQFNRRVRYADGGLVGAGISGDPLFDFGSDPYQMPIPSKGYEAGYRDQFALSNYPDPYLTDTAGVPFEPTVPTAPPEVLEAERQRINNEFNNLNVSYSNWLGAFQPKNSISYVDNGKAISGGIPVEGIRQSRPVWDQFQKDLDNYNKSVSEFKKQNPPSLGYTAPQLARDDMRESIYLNALRMAGIGIPQDPDSAEAYVTYPTTPVGRGYANGGAVGSVDPSMAQTGFQQGNLSYSNDEMKEITNLTVAAIKGEIDNAQSIIQQFISIFGQEEFDRLVQVVGQGAPADEGPVSGPGGPRDDLIPAVINGQQPARLSDGEYIIPADAVAGIGDGDPELGNERLNQMVSSARTGAGIS